MIDPYDVELAPSLWAGKVLAIEPDYSGRENAFFELERVSPGRYRDGRGRGYRAERHGLFRRDGGGPERYAVAYPWQPFVGWSTGGRRG